jgi:hypothetical protein
LAHSLRFVARRTLWSLADRFVTNPAIRWTWTGPSSDQIQGGLRPVVGAQTCGSG